MPPNQNNSTFSDSSPLLPPGGGKKMMMPAVAATKKETTNISSSGVVEFNTTAAALDGSVTVTTRNQLRPLHCAAQEYAWGRLGSSSSVALMKDAQAMQEGDGLFSIDEDIPYAELWLGTHPSGMSMVTVQEENDNDVTTASTKSKQNNNPQKHALLDYIRQDPALHCGDPSATDISFLLKVLSVRKVLSIQAHPDKALAERLHADFPDVYKDPNHKPEMAIAMSDQARAMCGFRPLSEIARHLDEYPEFRTLIGEETANEIKQGATKNCSPEDIRTTLQNMFKAYLEAPDAFISQNVDAMVHRLQQMRHHHNDLQKLILQLEQQFPGDCGIFSPLIFNIVELQNGQGLYIGANEPHAYISGEILECMACSDNVVRAGLTPKLKDVPTLVNMLTYKTCMPEIHNGIAVDECTTRYQPPVSDFCVEIVYIPPCGDDGKRREYVMANVASPAVLLTMEGDATLQQEGVCSLDVSYGSAAFCSANTKCTIVAGPYGIRLTRAFTNVFLE